MDNKPLAVVWDMDGVLVDTGVFHFQAWQDVMAKHQIPFSWEFFQSTFGMNNTGLLGKLLGATVDPELVKVISQEKEFRFRQLIHGKVQPLPGVKSWLQRLCASNIPQAVASSAPQANIDQLLEELSLCEYFLAVLSAEFMPGKPDPAVFLKAANLLNVDPAFCIVVEDSIAGVEAAKRAGMKCIAVTNTNPTSVLQAADLVIDSLENLTEDNFHII
jgi:beta-phosphoglucomutase family hydrolase